METNKLSVPAAIIIAGVLIAGVLFYNGKQEVKVVNNNNPEPASYALDKMTPPDNAVDHVRGNLNAPIVIVEYSDLECPFCQEFHKTMNQARTVYGDKIAWIYRHLPLDRHPKALEEAEATECVAELGGTEKFWAYVDKIFEVTPANNGLDLALLPQMAEDLGINRAQFEACMTSDRHLARIEANVNDAVAIGVRGTPFSVMITKNGAEALDGYLPFEAFQQMADKILNLN